MSAGEGGRWGEGRGEKGSENSQGGDSDQCTCTLHASTYHGVLTQLVYGSLPRLSLLCCVLTYEKWFGPISIFFAAYFFSISIQLLYSSSYYLHEAWQAPDTTCMVSGPIRLNIGPVRLVLLHTCIRRYMYLHIELSCKHCSLAVHPLISDRGDAF